MSLNRINKIPEQLLSCDVKDIHQILGGPTLLEIPGEREEALFIGCLLHGNETTSFLAIQRLLNKFKDKILPRKLVIFFGNTLGASQGLRHLPEQPDYNRIWEDGETYEHGISKEVLAFASETNLFACLDIHNNTGKNPFYGCINYTKKQWIELASLFSNQIVYFTEPSEVLSNAFSQFCPSVTIEAGLPGEEDGIEAVLNYIEKVLALEGFDSEFNVFDVEVYHTIGRIKIHKDAIIDFEGSIESQSSISFIPNIDEKNFEVVKRFTNFGFAKNLDFISAINNNDDEITNDIFVIADGHLQSNRIFIPAMFTKDVYIMKEDCMGYIMEKIIPLKA